MVLTDLAPSLWINENQPSLLSTSTLTCKRKAPTATTCGCVTSTDRQLNDLVELYEVLSDATKAQEQEKQYRVVCKLEGSLAEVPSPPENF